MKTVSIGDTHGMAVVDSVMKIIDNFDKFIFVGDYVDSFDVDDHSMKTNLLDLIELKSKYPEKVVLLWGNHDIHYLLGKDYYCSGYRPGMRKVFHTIFQENEKLFQFSYQSGDYIWTHAGITEFWFEKKFRTGNIELTIADLLNEAFTLRYPPLFDIGYNREGRQRTGGPLWCDKAELISGPLKGYNQIVGHNRVEEVEILWTGDKKIILIDVLENNEEVDGGCFFYLVLNNKKLATKP